MNFNLRTSKYAAESLRQLHAATSITPNLLIRFAVSLSLRKPEQVEVNTKEHSDGLTLHRSTVTGNYDNVYFALIAQHCRREITDTEYFPGLFNAHLERGIRLLNAEYKTATNSERFFKTLMSI
ncbi:DNA sulfur modification protein DndE [Paenibacillus hexagrammi]|uniref:DNA sulfur modification protein DndE n=1 Tax=Paenibacillus hexagrammi TaxID=2908839 RepID=A0ABY3SFR1_9BACL|nr:DNA sulfur modification protein DndE [Paenibacillus sp. YPD9-1]UJF32657.1 DNA sulfur modification protein DndE [Paenibacillus sp. YPD9-1]